MLIIKGLLGMINGFGLKHKKKKYQGKKEERVSNSCLMKHCNGAMIVK